MKVHRPGAWPKSDCESDYYSVQFCFTRIDVHLLFFSFSQKRLQIVETKLTKNCLVMPRPALGVEVMYSGKLFLKVWLHQLFRQSNFYKHDGEFCVPF